MLAGRALPGHVRSRQRRQRRSCPRDLSSATRDVCTRSTTGRKPRANSAKVCSGCTQTPRSDGPDVNSVQRCLQVAGIGRSDAELDKGGFLSVVLWVHTCQVRDH